MQCVCGEPRLWPSSCATNGAFCAGVVPETGLIFERLLEHCWVTISTVMVRKTLFEEVGWFNPEPPYGYLGEDHEFFLRVARRHPIELVAVGSCG